MRSQDYHIFIKPFITFEIVTLVNQILVKNNLSIKADKHSSIRLYDYEIGEDEFYFTTEDIVNPKLDLDKIKNNPSGGSISYQYFNSEVLISFNIIDCELYSIDTISISFHFQIYELYQELIDNLIKVIHNKTNAIRTIGGENISDDVDTAKNELKNAKKGIFEQRYVIDWQSSHKKK